MAARSEPPRVPEGLIDRVLVDAERLRPDPAPVGWRGWFRLLGGAPGLGGLVTAACVGVWLGVAPPDLVLDLAGTVMGTDAGLIEDGDAGVSTAFGWYLEES